MCKLPKQYNAPAEKTVFCASTHDDSNDSSDSGYATSNTNGFGNEIEDSVNTLYQSYNVMKDANCGFHSHNALNTIMVQAHLEYKDHFMGLSQNQCNQCIICDNGADTWVISDGWTILDKDPICMANLVAFDPAKMCKNGCPIVTASTTVKDANGNLIMIVVHDTVHKKGSPITLCSKFQTHESGVSINLIAVRHQWVDGEQGTQSIYLHNDNDTVIPMKIQAAVFCFQHWPINDSKTFPVHYMTNIGPWEPRQYYDTENPLDLVISPTSMAYNAMSLPTDTMDESNTNNNPDYPSCSNGTHLDKPTIGTTQQTTVHDRHQDNQQGRRTIFLQSI